MPESRKLPLPATAKWIEKPPEAAATAAEAVEPAWSQAAPAAEPAEPMQVDAVIGEEKRDEEMHDAVTAEGVPEEELQAEMAVDVAGEKEKPEEEEPDWTFAEAPASSQAWAPGVAPAPSQAEKPPVDVEAIRVAVEERQRLFLEKMNELQKQHDFADEQWRLTTRQIMEVPRAQHDRAWLARRRAHREELWYQCVRRRQDKDELELDFAMDLRDLLRDLDTEAQTDAVPLAEFASVALDKLAAWSQEEEQMEVSPRQEPPASSQDPRPRPDYISEFCKLAGRRREAGPPGIWTEQPPITAEQQCWTNVEWAQHWLRLGGFPDAATLDVNGWLPLHHAIQATVYWSMAARVVLGLIPMTPSWGLRAKTGGGRPTGWAPLHMCANGSDRDFQRAALCRTLLHAQAEVNQLDDAGSTPLLRAVATGVVDVAEVLLAARADVNARNAHGAGALAIAARSSTAMRTLMTMAGAPRTLPAGGGRYRSRGWVSDSRWARQTEGAAAGFEPSRPRTAAQGSWQWAHWEREEPRWEERWWEEPWWEEPWHGSGGWWA